MKKEIKRMISLDVKDQPISKVLEQIQEHLDSNLIYSKTVLANQQGTEHLITAKIDKVNSETALYMIVKSVGMIIEEFENGHLVIRESGLDDDIDTMNLDDDDDDREENLPF